MVLCYTISMDFCLKSLRNNNATNLTYDVLLCHILNNVLLLVISINYVNVIYLCAIILQNVYLDIIIVCTMNICYVCLVIVFVLYLQLIVYF